MNYLKSFAILLLSTLAAAQDSTTDEFPEDPYLQFRPPFVRSLPVQILLTGVVLTLTVVLFIHLMFTAQYHWPLAPVNYVLQVSGVTTLLISLIATIHVVLSTSSTESESWPYMLSYIAVNVPPINLEDDSEGWSVAEKATWLVMTASTSGLIQITHIQFLTLLYPSRLEKQLIFALLGPLAVVAAVMQLIPIKVETAYVAGAVKNVCNATLSLLFTVALFIWGLLVNRQQAWRTDGGTAVFGCAALALALVSTALNFLYVHREEEYVWLPGLMWAVVLWQSFLGWWWWVGAGSGNGLGGDEGVEAKLRREAKRENRRREARERRQETKNRAKKVWRDVTGAFGREQQDESTVIQSSSFESRPRSPSQLSYVQTRLPPRRTSPGGSPRSIHASSPPTSPVRSVESSSSSSSGDSGTLPRVLPNSIHRFYASVRHAHLIAAQKQAAERVERIREMRNSASNVSRSTWGVSNLLWRSNPKRGASVGGDADPGVEGDKEEGTYELYERRARRRSRRSDDDGDEIVDEGGYPGHLPFSEEERGEVDQSPSRGREREREGERGRDGSDSGRGGSTNPTSITVVQPENSAAHPPERPRSIWWWGPLWRWRLQDSTTYS